MNKNMRRPFIFFLVAISLYCWLSDLVEFLFYIFHLSDSYKKVYGNIISISVLVFLSYALKKFVYKNSLTKEVKNLFQQERKREWLLLLVVSMPIIVLGFYRLIYPDQNYDTFHFELYLQEYKLGENKTNFAAGSIRTYYFPLAERIFALFRHVLGYRLGVVLNIILLITIIISLYDFIIKTISLYRINATSLAITSGLLSLFVIFSDNTLFNIGSYKPDLIGIPLILELMHIVFFKKLSMRTIDHLIFYLLASLIITYKLTYLPYVGILILIYFIKSFKKDHSLRIIAYLFIILVFPSIYLIYNLVETGNPIFPFFNKLFHSSLYPYANFKDLRWGPKNIYEAFIYPVVTYLDKSRCNEWSLYSYRLLFGYFISLATIFFYLVRIKNKKTDLFLRSIFFIALFAVFFDYACMMTTGYYRYGIIVEVLYGIVIALWLLYFQKRVFSVFWIFIIFFQSYITFKNIFAENINLSWHDYKELITNKKILKNNVSRIMNDYNYITDSDQVLSKIDGFVCLEPFPQEGLSKMLNKNVPIYNIDYSARTLDTVFQFEKTVLREKTQKKNLMVVANIESLNSGVVRSLNKRGYLATEMHELYPRYMKFDEPLFLFRIKYFDTSKYNIKLTEQYIRDENPQETRNDFIFHSSSKMKIFIREAPFAFTWYFLPDQYEIIINQQNHLTNNRFKKNKIFTVEGNDLQIHKPNSVPYMVLIQEIEEKH